MQPGAWKNVFIKEVRKALIHLYDPAALRHSPLVPLFNLKNSTDIPSELREKLNRSIEALRPKTDIPSESNAWRLYNILYYRFTEQSPQSEVASDLALGIRQLRRQEKIALEMLSEYLWSEYNLDEDQAAGFLSLIPVDRTEIGDRMPSRDEELDWLDRNTPFEEFDIREILQDVLRKLNPIFVEQGMAISVDVITQPARVNGKSTEIRQAVMNLLSVAAFFAYEGQIFVEIDKPDQKGFLHLGIRTTTGATRSMDNKKAEDLKIASRLIQLSRGELIIQQSPEKDRPFIAEIVLLSNEQIQVVALDDNVDTLELLKRYLSDTRYNFIGTSNPSIFFSQIESEIPDVIILDVMLPGIDGWEILGRLRENPRTQRVPVIISTILHQEQLAIVLGATEFIHKPINREKLILQLDRLIDLGLKKQHSSS
jgi:CheY-like chemotaxis protein